MANGNQTSQNNKIMPIKKKGPIRWEAIIPFVIICVIIGAYFHFFFDHNLKSAFEYIGTKVVGAEVNVGQVETSFSQASLKIGQIQVTDAEKPTHNSISIGEIRFSMLWDALLRVKFVINEAVIEQIEFAKKRAHIGKVLPPPPPEPEDNKPSVVAEQAEKLKKAALEEAQSKYNDNIFGDVAALLGGGSTQVQLDKLQDKLVSKEMAQKIEQEVKTKQKNWEERLKNLPQTKDFQSLSDRLSKVKTKDFKSPQELSDSLKEFDTIFKEADAKYKLIQTASTDLTQDLKTTQNEISQLEAQVKSDIKDLEKHFKIPQIDAKSLTLALFKKYLDPYMAKINHYRALANKYLPPNLLKKKDPKASAEEDAGFQPHPREKGMTYEFGRPNSYPLFWIKRTAVSSQAGKTPESGNIKGEILNITSHQKLINKPTTANLSGNFPGLGINDFLFKLVFDLRPSPNVTNIQFKVGSYSIDAKPLVESNDVGVNLTKAQGSMDIKTQIEGFKNITFDLKNKFTNASYDIKAKDGHVQDILKGVFEGLPEILVSAKAQGTLPKVPFDIESNLGSELQKGIEKQLQAKIDEARKKIEAYVNGQIAEQRKNIESQINQVKNQFEKEIKKVQEQAESQKKQVESKVEQAKKDGENQAKKKLEQEGQKALDDLKKKFGF